MRGAWEPTETAIATVEHAAALDAPAKAVARVVEQVLPTGALRDLLHGVWLGHPLHPVLTDLPIGSWTSAMLLDIVGGRAGAGGAQTLTGFGCLAALPTAVSGAADFSRLDTVDQRVGIVHAATNSVALGLYTWSWVERRRGRRGRGIVLGFVAATAATAGGLLGGHLAFRRAVGPNRVADVEPPDEWTDAVPHADDAAAAGRLAAVDVEVLEVDGDAVLVDTRSDSGIAARCSHAGGPLAEGDIEGMGRDRCVVCPWHGSTFRLADGTVVHGPATSPQPAYDARRGPGGRREVRGRRAP